MLSSPKHCLHFVPSRRSLRRELRSYRTVRVLHRVNTDDDEEESKGIARPAAHVEVATDTYGVETWL